MTHDARTVPKPSRASSAPPPRLAAMALATFTLAGCGPGMKTRAGTTFTPSSSDRAHEEKEPEGRITAQPFALAVAEDAIVRIVGPSATCTGTVIDDDLVLTAHHCVVARGARGELTKELLAVDDLRVELGGDYFAWGEVSVRHVVVPPCGEAGGAGDVAVLVLGRKLVGLTAMTPRLDTPPRIGEEVTPVGFGRCALSADGIRRKERGGGAIRALTSETLHLDAAVCPGDSGGPVLAKGSREILGVVSLSAMDHDERTKGPSVMARIDAQRLVFAHARLVADGMSPNELPPLDCRGVP